MERPHLACLKPFAQQPTDDRTDITPLSDIPRPEPEPAHELVDDGCVDSDSSQWKDLCLLKRDNDDTTTTYASTVATATI